MSNKIVEHSAGTVEFLPTGDMLITVRWQRLFGLLEPSVVQYRGGSTVWHNAETGRRQPTHVERVLSDIATKAKWDLAKLNNAARENR